ncbi:MAG: lysophospholipid acyltransferase family protein [Gammaproteobacteria bacterium]
MNSLLRPLRHAPTWIGLALLRVLAVLPLPVLAALGRGLGLLLYALHASRRHVVRVNVARCFPGLTQRAQERLVRGHFKAFGQALVDIALAWWASGARLKRLVRFKGREHYDRALGAGRPVILLAPHFVGLEIGGMRLSMERPMVTMFRHPANELLRRVMQRARARFGLRLVEHNRPLTALVRQVKAGVPLYYLPDQDAGRRNGVFAPFFGIPTATFPVLGRLAQLADAVVIPCVTRQLPRGRGYEIMFAAPLADFPSGDTKVDTERMNRAIEQAVREIPEQYFWVHKRFKTRPRGEASFY